MDISIYFSPIPKCETEYYQEQLGSLIGSYFENTDFPSWEEAEIVLIGVNEERGSPDNLGCANGPNEIRKQLNKLFFDGLPPTVDLGNILAGETIDDTYFAVQSTIDTLIKAGKVVVVLGGSQDLTIPLYKGYENSEQLVNLTTIDQQFDIGENTEDLVNTNNYLSQILLHQPSFLFNYANLGYQTYFGAPKIIGLMDKLFFDKVRLGEVRGGIRKAEPILRNSDILSFDVSSIQSADMGGCARSTPNGLLPDEACQLTRYAGLSEKISCFGVFEYNPAFDSQGRSALLVSQMIWYFLEGYVNRKNETPSPNDKNYLKYRVPVTGTDEDVVFYKSLRTDRWWMLVPYPETKSTRYRRLNMVPCSYQDYLIAGQDELPDLWVKTYRKFL
ncbi:MAG: formimidoylglutamase [Salibacteraceae bacterium]